MGRVIGVLGLFVIVAAAATAAIVGPELVGDELYSALRPTAKATAIATLRLHFLYMLGGSIAIVTLIYAHLRHRRESEQLELDRARAINERFEASVEQLASESTSVRMGATFTFQRIAQESVANRRAIWMLLHAAVQQHERPRAETSAEISTALEVLTSAPVSGASKIQLRGVSLRSVDVRNADLVGARLEWVDLAESSVVDSIWREVQAIGCNLAGGSIGEVSVSSFELCNLRGARLVVSGDVSFIGCDLTGARISVEVDYRTRDAPRISISESVVDSLLLQTFPERFRLLKLDMSNCSWSDDALPQLEIVGDGGRGRTVDLADLQLRSYIQRVVAVSEGRESALLELSEWLRESQEAFAVNSPNTDDD